MAASPPYSELDNKGTQILCVLIITTTLALIAFALRMYVRLRIIKNTGWDDYTMIAAIVFAIVVLVFESIAIKHGIGTHKVFLTRAGAIEAAKWSTLTITPNVLTTMMARISICLFMLRIVNKTTTYRYFLVSIIIGTAAIGTLTVLNTYITCKPVPKIWNSALPGTCNPRSRYAIGMTQAVWTISADWLVALFPILMLNKLQMAFKTKVALGTIMSLGFLIGIVVLLKTLKVGALFSRSDSTYDGADLATWSFIEQNVGIIIANVPGIRPLFSRTFALTKKASQFGSRYNDRGYKMDDLTGNLRSDRFHSEVVTTSTRKEADSDPSGSQSSLVAKHFDGGITKTLGVSVTSIHNDQRVHVREIQGADSPSGRM